MPGLLTLRPPAAPAKSSSAATKNATMGGRGGGRDEARAPGQQQQGKGGVAPPLARARVPRAGALLRMAPVVPPRHVPQHLLQFQQELPGGDEAEDAAEESPAPPPPPPAGRRDRLESFRRAGGVDYSSSGSEHEPTSVCLAEMVFDYIEEDPVVRVGKCGRARCNCSSANACSGRDLSLHSDADDSRAGAGEVADVLLGLIPCANGTERSIAAAVASALKALEGDDESEENGDAHPDEKEKRKSVRSASSGRWVMNALRSSGYNAAICKSRWEHAGGFPGGDYEYMDVVVAGGERIVVDMEFRAQFEIARPTGAYSALVQVLPRVFVGSPERLHRLVNIMCDAAKRSLKKKGMHLPPWRKADYILAKWFSAYRRTTNALAASAGAGADDGSTESSPETETDCRKAAAGPRPASRDSKRSHAALQQPIGVAMAMASNKEVDIPDVTEGKVRGAANFLGLLGRFAMPPGADTTAEWEPPPVALRRPSTERVGGLVSILGETRQQQPQPQQAPQSGPRADQEGSAAAAAAAAVHAKEAGRRRTASALSKQMVLTAVAV